MCGLAAIFNYNLKSEGINPEELIAIRDAMRNRGPDAAGLWIHKNRKVGLAHRRLSIIDLSDRSNQPLESQDKKFIISFNGEIYNYRLLKNELQAKGYEFQTESDTEVILNLYRDKGDDLCTFLRGMYAFAIWDEVNQKLVVARDPYGIKPLYFSDDGKSIRIASQVKALCHSEFLKKNMTLSAAGITGFLLLGSIPEPFTSYHNIRAIPAGTIMTVDGTGRRIKKFFSLCESYSQFNNVKVTHDSSEFIKNALLDSVQSHLEADVPVGIFLSSGIDSCSLLALMKKAGYEDISGITLSFREFEGTQNDEAPLARKIAERYSVNHTVDYISFQDFSENLPIILNDMDQPSVDGINTWFVSRAVHKHGLKVALSGLGGDELFGGYPSFSNVPRMMRLGKQFGGIPGFPWLFHSLISILGKFKFVNEKTRHIPNFYQDLYHAYILQRSIFLPHEIERILGKEFVQRGFSELIEENYCQERLASCPDDEFARISVLETELYMRNQLLRDSDWAGMAHSVEIRVPLVDVVLLNKLGPAVIQSKGKHGKKIMSEVSLSIEELNLLNRKKTGFGLPLQEWFTSTNNVFTRKGNIELHNDSHWSKKYALHVLDVFHGKYY